MTARTAVRALPGCATGLFAVCTVRQKADYDDMAYSRTLPQTWRMRSRSKTLSVPTTSTPPPTTSTSSPTPPPAATSSRRGMRRTRRTPPCRRELAASVRRGVLIRARQLSASSSGTAYILYNERSRIRIDLFVVHLRTRRPRSPCEYSRTATSEREEWRRGPSV